ncbi:hypothetical protein BC940DRAFT_267402 [Gongronella butleri]|nr:hypothetical protein BC940DRAFT_267402 [Gongronella butleri]
MNDWSDLFGSDDEVHDEGSVGSWATQDAEDVDERNAPLTTAAGAAVDTFDAIPGLYLWRDALTHEEQMAMLRSIIDSNVFGNRNQAMLFGTLPEHLQWLSDHLHAQNILPHDLNARKPLFNQAIYNRYEKGEGILPHVDLARFEDGIVILSLLSSCCMSMRPADASAIATAGFNGDIAPISCKKRASVDLLLNPGDILVLTGEARYQWTHSIPELNEDYVDGRRVMRGNRVSVTLRRLLE